MASVDGRVVGVLRQARERSAAPTNIPTLYLDIRREDQPVEVRCFGSEDSDANLKLVFLSYSQGKSIKAELTCRATLKGDSDRLDFLSALAKKVDKPEFQDAYVYATVHVASVYLTLNEHEKARADLDRVEAILDTFDSVETVVHAAFYRINAQYYQVSNFTSKSDESVADWLRVNSNSAPTTRMRSSTWPASTSKNSHRRNGNLGPTI